MDNSLQEQRPTRILLVDDDERLQAVVREFLQNYGFEVISLGSGAGLDETVAESAPDLVLLDVMLPGDDGFTLLRKLRAKSKLPVIMLTACGDDTDRIIGLEIGADDYLPKPYNPRELLARIKAVLRRAPLPGADASPVGAEISTSENASDSVDPNNPADSKSSPVLPDAANPAELAQSGDPAGLGDSTSPIKAKNPAGSGKSNAKEAWLLQAGPYTLDARHQSLSLNGNSVELSGTEYRIVQAFMSHEGEVLARDRVLALAFGEDHYVCDRNIDVYISRLRNILRNLGENETRIRTVWGSGYSWIATDSNQTKNQI